MERTESIILRSLLYDDDYLRRVLPFLESEYFHDKTERSVFERIKDFVGRYNVLPTRESLVIEFSESRMEQDELDEVVNYLTMLESEKDEKPNDEWLTETTEKWCQDSAIHNAVLEAIQIIEGTSKSKKDKGILPKLLQDALSVSFDPHVGHDYFGDAESRFDFYKRVDSRIPFHLDYFNRVTKNGIPRKTLNICLAGTNVGKSLFMCDLAANYLLQGKNVLYISMEMAEERIAERIDANLMDRQLDDLQFMAKDAFQKNIERINSITKGRLIIKEYPTASAHVGHFRHLLQELALKKKFKPDAIFIDYLNICGSSRIRPNTGMYELVKSIAEELRGLAVEFDVPIWSATQMNRQGYNSSDPDLTNTSESFGLPATADFMFALINSDELKGMNQLLVKILKNRFGDVNIRNKETGKVMNKFVVGVDRSKQKLFNLDESAQADLDQDDDTPPDWNASSSRPKPGPNSGGSNDVVFDIDLPTGERPFNGAEEDAERRRTTAKNGSSPFKPHLQTRNSTKKELFLG